MSNRKKDWVGGSVSIYSSLGSSSHSDRDRAEYDFYATPPEATDLLMKYERLSPVILEPACGEGNIAIELEANGHSVILNDIVKRNYGNYEPKDFMDLNTGDGNYDIVTNPPYRDAAKFVYKACTMLTPGHKSCMFLKLTFLEGIGRKELFDKYPPTRVYVFRKRVNCGLNGKFDNAQSAVCYAWFVWEYHSNTAPIIRWIDSD